MVFLAALFLAALCLVAIFAIILAEALLAVIVLALPSAHPSHPRCPAEPLTCPCCCPPPSTETAARKDGATTNEAPWAEEEVGRSSATGVTGLSTELILGCAPTIVSFFSLVSSPVVLIFFSEGDVISLGGK